MFFSKFFKKGKRAGEEQNSEESVFSEEGGSGEGEPETGSGSEEASAAPGSGLLGGASAEERSSDEERSGVESSFSEGSSRETGSSREADPAGEGRFREADPAGEGSSREADSAGEGRSREADSTGEGSFRKADSTEEGSFREAGSAGENSFREADSGEKGGSWTAGVPAAGTDREEKKSVEGDGAEEAAIEEDGAGQDGSRAEDSTAQAGSLLEDGSAAADSPAEEENPAEEKKKKKGFFARLKEGLAKTRDNIVRGIDSVFNGFTAIDDDFYEELEEILIMGDIGVNATTEIVARLKAQVKERHLKEPKECKQLLIEGIKEQMRVDAAAYDFEKRQSVIMVIGVNGAGKTTSVGKLAGKLKEDGRKVLIAAADTFRAAAGDQLAEWARRADVPMVGGREGADPASVVFDAVSAAKARGVDVLLVDTAGRLHNKKNLMEELRKMNRIIDREFPDAHRENLIVLDGTTGQNALVQAREFGSVAQLTGIILTKMDGTAKGGIAVAIQSELRVPVKYIGVGETIDDLQKFDSDEFVNALFDVKPDDEEE